MCTEIINGLYISGYRSAFDDKLLKELGITHIINCSGLRNAFPEQFQYLRIDISDDKDEDIKKYFNKSAKFITNAFVNRGKVLVHCVAGKSRSVSIVVSFLCKKRRYTLKDALEFVSKRRRIDINEGFHSQLINTYL